MHFSYEVFRTTSPQLVHASSIHVKDSCVFLVKPFKSFLCKAIACKSLNRYFKDKDLRHVYVTFVLPERLNM